MMIYASIGQALSYMLITILLRYNELPGYSGSKQVASASVAFFFTYYICFGIGFQGVPWLYPTEINSLSMRTKGAALGTASNWAFNFMVVEVTPPGIQNLHWRYYLIWTIFNASFVPIIYLFYPETADRTLEDVDRLFRENQNVGSTPVISYPTVSTDVISARYLFSEIQMPYPRRGLWRTLSTSRLR